MIYFINFRETKTAKVKDRTFSRERYIEWAALILASRIAPSRRLRSLREDWCLNTFGKQSGEPDSVLNDGRQCA